MLKLGLGLFAASCLFAYGFSQEKWVPGVSLSSESLDSTVALGCDQTITAQTACKYTSPGCKPWLKLGGGQVLGAYCINDGALLGCTGGVNEACTGPINPDAETKCAVSNDLCCTPTLACMTELHPGIVPGGYTYTCSIVASSTGPVGDKTVGETLPCKKPVETPVEDPTLVN